MKLYLAGPMRGIAEFNFPAFFEAADRLRDEGHVVFNPAEEDVKRHGDKCYKNLKGDLDEISEFFNLRETFQADLMFICSEADGIAMLPGWERSTGARAEWATAQMLGLETMYLNG